MIFESTIDHFVYYFIAHIAGDLHSMSHCINLYTYSVDVASGTRRSIVVFLGRNTACTFTSK